MNSFEPDFHKTGRRTGIQLAYPFEAKRLSKWEPPFIVQPKLDGERCRAVVRNGSVVLLSSEANVIESVPHINKALQEKFRSSEIELDGELYCHGKSLQEIHSIVSRRANLHPQFEDIQFFAFDIIDTSLIQAKRNIILHALGLDKYPFSVVPFQLCSTFDAVMSQLEWSMKEGFEGIIVRHFSAPYIRRRSTMMMKFKPKKEDLYEIVSFTEAVSIHGQPKGCLGAIICRSQIGEELFHVGSGFNDEERASLWRDRDSLPGKLVRVKYQSLTSLRGVPRSAVYDSLVIPYSERSPSVTD